MGISPALDYLSMPSSVEDRHDAVLAALALLDVHLLAVKIDVVPFDVACLKGAKAAAVDDREQRDGTLSIATSEIFYGIVKQDGVLRYGNVPCWPQSALIYTELTK